MEDSLIFRILDIYAKVIIIISPFGAIFFILLGILMLRSTLIIEGIGVGTDSYSESTLASLMAGAAFVFFLVTALVYKSYRSKYAAKKAAKNQIKNNQMDNNNSNIGITIQNSA
ncbi:hypothetical protein FG386_002429 [Cryptosporidium ryanae]|uniref:uncharacterized protein n=1 Tax=Cryptosporidium ryanae TaxID=515981 RepID=UPI00351A7D92|nr:hypothetical protein FG386_002429 [Cryptosporidium ryanae]